MNTSNFENLDLICAKEGKGIGTPSSKELEKLITDALAVLEEQGVYAFFLFLKSNKKDKNSDIYNALHVFIHKTPSQSPLLSNSDEEDILESNPQMFNDLDKLLLARDLLRQTLVYARYHAKCEDAQ